MKLEDQVCSLELSKKLKELGVIQESLFYYQNNLFNDGEECIDLMINESISISIHLSNSIINTESPNEDNPKFSAFTIAELGILLPEIITSKDGIYFYITMDCNKYIYYEDIGKKYEVHCDEISDYDSEADGRAKMLIYLIEKCIVTVESINERMLKAA